MSPDDPEGADPQTTQPGDGGQGAPPKRGRAQGVLRRHPIAVGIGVIVLIVVLILILLWWLNARQYESTDDAFVDAHIVRVAPQVAGRVVRVLVENYQSVKPGQTLMQIDANGYQARLDQALATRAQAQAAIAQAQAELPRIEAQINANQASARQAQAAAAAARATATNAAQNLARYRRLEAINTAAVARQQLDQATAQAESAAAQARAAQQQADAAQSQVAATAAQRRTAQAQIQAGRAQLQNAEAEIQAARLDVGYTEVKAADAGTIANRTVSVGDYLAAGTQAMAIVPFQVWVTANFKETQLAHMRPGQPASVRVDACPGHTFRGHVDSIQRGSGSAFAILPPENATGNFVKVVQRVPVRIVIDDRDATCPLGPGLSTEPKVKVR